MNLLQYPSPAWRHPLEANIAVYNSKGVTTQTTFDNRSVWELDRNTDFSSYTRVIQNDKLTLRFLCSVVARDAVIAEGQFDPAAAQRSRSVA